MSEPINLAQLRAKASRRFAAGIPLGYDQAVLALIDAVEAAWQELPAEDDFAHCAHPNTRAALARFDFGDA